MEYCAASDMLPEPVLQLKHRLSQDCNIVDETLSSSMTGKNALLLQRKGYGDRVIAAVARSISESSGLSMLLELNVADNRLSTGAVVELCKAARSLDRLEIFDISYNQVSSRSVFSTITNQRRS